MKRVFLFLSLLLAALVLAACPVSDGSASGWVTYTQPDGSQVTVPYTGTIVTGPAAPVIPAGGSPASVAPVVVPSDCVAPDFASFVGDPYGLIAKLDAQNAKIPQSTTPFTISATECVLYWTGAYTGGVFPTGFVPIFVDGQTGVFLIRQGTTVTLSSVGAWMPLSSFDPNAVVVASSAVPTGCMPAEKALVLINTYGKSNPDYMFDEFDKAVNVEGAPWLNARMRPTPDGPAQYQAQNTQALWWVRTGNIEGPVIELVQSLGKSLYLSTADGQIDVTWAHAGVVLCTPLNPAADITWWGN